MKLSKKTRYLLICLLILLVIVVRLPSYPYERGSPDEYTIHATANSVSEYGYAKWWLNPWCIFGWYPYSYSSSSPFLFSGASQSTGLSMGCCAWVICTIMGIFIALSAYVMAGQIRDDDLFKFLVALFISVSQGVLTYTTWQVSARGTFLIFVPLFVFLLLRMRNFAVRGGVLAFSILVFLAATHHYVYFIIPMIFAFIVSVTAYRLKTMNILSKIKFPEMVTSIFLAISLIVAFSIPFVTGIFISYRYEAIPYLLGRSVRYVGLIFPIAIGGITYLIFKHKKESGELFILLCLIFFSPLMYVETYYPFFGAILLCTFIGVGVANIGEAGINKKRMLSVMCIFILLFTGFSVFYQHYRTSSHSHTFYMETSVYTTGTWIKNNLQESRMVSNDYYSSARILSVSEVPILALPLSDMVYGFVDVEEDIKVIKNSPLSEVFYRDNPYVLSNEVACYMFIHNYIQTLDIDSSQFRAIVDKKHITHFVESEYYHESTFTRSIAHANYDEIFDNGNMHIWCVNTPIGVNTGDVRV